MSTSQDLVSSLKTILAAEAERLVVDHATPESAETNLHRESVRGAVNGIATIYDIANYLDSLGQEPEEFFIAHQVPLITAGMSPLDVPTEVIQALGVEVASDTWAGGSWATVYQYDGLFFVIDEVETRVFKTLTEATASAGIASDAFDKLQD